MLTDIKKDFIGSCIVAPDATILDAVLVRELMPPIGSIRGIISHLKHMENGLYTT